MKKPGLRSTLSSVASLAAISLFLFGPPFVDRWGSADITVTIAQHLSPPTGAQVLVVEVVRIVASDVTGSSAQGLPVGPAADRARILPATLAPTTLTGVAHDEMTDHHPTWFYAFVDLNDNRRLDTGEPFGTDPRNPSSAPDGNSCVGARYQGAITIAQIFP